MENTELAVMPQQSLFVSPVVGLAEAKSKFEQVREFTASCLTKGVDYGNFAGVAKPSLLKPGAEKLGSLFGLTPRFHLIDKVMNWNGEGNPDNEPFFYFEYKCELYRSGEFVASCDASCNSWEKKYRYRKAELRCPNCGKATIIKGKKEYGGGWICYGKKGGCGAKFPDNDPRFNTPAEVKNYDTAEQVNTFQKMAQKRAYVGAILIACNLSEYYTQDIEDMTGSFIPDPEMVEGEFTPVSEPQRTQAAPNGQRAYNSTPASEKPAEGQRKPFDEVAFLKDWQQKVTVIVGDSQIALPEISMEMACDIDTRNSDGTVVKMGSRKTGELAGMWKAYKQRLNDPEANREDVLMRLSAVNKILTSRAKAQADLESLG